MNSPVIRAVAMPAQVKTKLVIPITTSAPVKTFTIFEIPMHRACVANVNYRFQSLHLEITPSSLVSKKGPWKLVEQVVQGANFL